MLTIKLQRLLDSLAIVDIGIDYDADMDKVEQTLNNVIEDLNKTLPKLKGNVELLGINELDDSSVVYRIIAPVSSMEQYKTERIMRKKIKLALDKAKIKIPYPQVEVHNGK